MTDLRDQLQAAVGDAYRIEREFGRGGMATVWLAQDVKLDRPVALKGLRPEIAAALGPERFLREIQIAARLTHPHILPLHDSGLATAAASTAASPTAVSPTVRGQTVIPMARRRCHPVIVGTALCLVAFTSAAANGRAQEAPAPAAADSVQPTGVRSPATAPTAVPASDIGIAAGQAIAGVRELSLQLTRDPRIIEIERELRRTDQSIAALRAATYAPALETRSLTEIEDLASQWQDVAATLSRWLGQLRRRTDGLGATRDSLARMRRRWELTRDAAAEERLPPTLAERVAEVLRELDRGDTAVRDRLNSVLAVQSDVVDASLTVAEILGEVDRARRDAARNLFTADRPPLWRDAFPVPSDTAPAALRLRDLTAARVNAAVAFLRARIGTLIALGLVCLVVAVAVRGFGRRAAAGEAAELDFLVRRPLSTGLLVAILLTPALLARSPVLVSNAVVLLLLPALARLVPGTAPESWRRPMIGTLGAMFLVQLTRLVQALPWVERVSLLIVALLVLAGAIAALRGLHPPRPVTDRGWAVRGLLRIGAVLLAGSVVLNVAGYVSLSQLLLTGTVFGATAAIAFFVGARAAADLAAMTIRQGLARLLSAVRTNQEALVRRSVRLVRVATALGWVAVVLNGFRLRDEVLLTLRAVLTARLAVGTVSLSLGDVLLFGAVLWVAVLVSRAIRFLLEDDLLPRLALPRGMPATVSTLLYYLLLCIGFVFAVGAAGLDLSRVTLLAGAFGIGIGFGLQNIVNNFVSGLILKFERPIAVGDVIELDTMMGTTQRIGIRSSTIRTFAGAEVIVPNADLVAGRLVNWTLSDRRRRIEIPVGVAYGSDPRQVLDLLIAVARAHPKVLADPPPSALFRGFGESSLDFELRCWTGDFDQWVLVSSEVTTAIHAALHDAGIEIPFPQRDLHLRTVAPAAAAKLSAREAPPT